MISPSRLRKHWAHPPTGWTENDREHFETPSVASLCKTFRSRHHHNEMRFNRSVLEGTPLGRKRWPTVVLTKEGTSEMGVLFWALWNRVSRCD
jgi:hypothetical protein